MYVCLCNRFNEKAVEATLKEKPEAAESALKLYAACTGGKPLRCGQCLPVLKNIINQTKQTLPPG